jgi:threonine/homoserine/homoserine lactone efflux protein
VAVIPLLVAAAPLGAAAATGVVLVYEVSTLATMVLLVLPARAGMERFRSPWLDRWGDAVAGGLIAGIGLAVSALGI